MEHLSPSAYPSRIVDEDMYTPTRYHLKLAEQLAPWAMGGDPIQVVSSHLYAAGMGHTPRPFPSNALIDAASQLRGFAEVAKHPGNRGGWTKKDRRDLLRMAGQLDQMWKANHRSKRQKQSNRATSTVTMLPWQGIDRNEKVFHRVRNGLVGLYLSGVRGIGTPVPGHEFKLLSQEEAANILHRGQEALAFFTSQKKGPTAKARRWMDSKTEELRRLLHNAMAVANGERPPKMTTEDYRKLDESLGIRPGDRGPSREPNWDTW